MITHKLPPGGTLGFATSFVSRPVSLGQRTLTSDRTDLKDTAKRIRVKRLTDFVRGLGLVRIEWL